MIVLIVPTTQYSGHEHAISVSDLACGHMFSETTCVCVLVMCMIYVCSNTVQSMAGQLTGIDHSL
jgi:hypothetical protein